MEKKMKRHYMIMYITMAFTFLFLAPFFIYGGVTKAFENSTFGIVAGIGLLLAGIFMVYYIITKDSFQKIREYVQQHPDITMEELEKDFNKGTKLGRVWIGDRWTFFMDDTGLPAVLDNTELVWAFFYRERYGRVSPGFLYTFNINRERVKVPISRKNSKKALKLFDEKFPYIVIGRNKENEELFTNDFNKFLKLRYHYKN